MTVKVAEHFHPIRMTCPIQPEPYFLEAPTIEESLRNSLPLRNPQWERTSIRLLLNSSSSTIHYEESHLVYGPLRSILLDQGILVKNKLDDALEQLPPLIPYYETSQHTSVNPLLHAAIKTLIQNLIHTFILVLLLFLESFSSGLSLEFEW